MRGAVLAMPPKISHNTLENQLYRGNVRWVSNIFCKISIFFELPVWAQQIEVLYYVSTLLTILAMFKPNSFHFFWFKM